MTASKIISKSTTKQSIKNKSVSKPGRPRRPDDLIPEVGELVRLHELKGIAVIHLPRELRQRLGDAAFEACDQELQAHELLMFMRRGNELVRLTFPLRVMEIEGTLESTPMPVVTEISVPDKKPQAPVKSSPRARSQGEKHKAHGHD
jgi:hypothetical protein